MPIATYVAVKVSPGGEGARGAKASTKGEKNQTAFAPFAPAFEPFAPSY